MPPTMEHPVVLTGRLEPGVSRWLWLVKWLLLVPHAVVLFFLWVAAGVLTVVAWFAILVTGRYPRAIFDFNLGVLRWSWRVWFYSYGALGTDRYPPFTLGEEPGYPATLDIAYPERLSRGLVLVKSWLLAIPHYLVLGFFLGVGTAAGGADRQPAWPWNIGLVGLLVLVAAVVLLFTARYPRPIFDLVLGMDRWAARVTAYALLMTDRYPPFRLDQGGEEPAPSAPPPAGGPTGRRADLPEPSVPEPSAAQPSQPGRRWTAPRIVGLTLGSVLLAGALLLGLAGGGLLFADKALRNDDGFLMTGGERLTTSSYAVASEDIDLDAGSLTDAVLGDVRLEVRDADAPVFVGIARTDQVRAYLDGVSHAVVTDVRDGTPLYRDVPGTAPAGAPPADVDWAASSAGVGTRTLEWDASDGHWTAVLMNADGTAGVSAVVSAGSTLPVVGWGAAALLSVAGVLGVVGLVLVLVSLPRPPRPSPQATAPQPVPPGVGSTVG